MHDDTCTLVRTQLFGSLPPTLEGEKRSANLSMTLQISTLVVPERKRVFSECWEREIACYVTLGTWPDCFSLLSVLHTMLTCLLTGDIATIENIPNKTCFCPTILLVSFEPVHTPRYNTR